MQSEDKHTKRVPKSKVSVMLRNVPVSVHKTIKKYRRDINATQNQDFTLMEAYVEFLKDKTASV